MATASSNSHQETVSQFDLQQEIAQANAHKPWASGIFSKTLLKQHDMRVVLIMMDADAGMHEHHADGSVLVQVLRGKLRIHAQNVAHDLTVGHLLSLPPSVKHDVHTSEPSAFLLTISWPESEKLRAMEHRGYGS